MTSLKDLIIAIYIINAIILLYQNYREKVRMSYNLGRTRILVHTFSLTQLENAPVLRGCAPRGACEQLAGRDR